MEFKIKRITIILLFIFIRQFGFSENPKIVKCPNNPIHGNLHLKLKKDLILGEETEGPYFFASVNGIEVSDKYIYVLDTKMVKVKIYDLKGKFVRDIGKKGEGPGEFMIPSSFCLSANNNIYIYDMMRRRMTIFNSNGDYKRDFLMGEIFPRKFYVDEENYIYTTFEKFYPENSNINMIFAKLNPEGKVERIFYKTFRLKLISFKGKGRAGNLLYEHPYLTYLYFIRTPEDNFVLMNSMKYEIILFLKKGDVLLKILKEEKGSKVTRKEKEIALSKERTGIPKELQKYATFSETRPFCSNLLSDEKGRIYVERFKPVTEKGGGFNYDIFNTRGEYLYKLSLPFKINLLKNGYIYTVSINEETGEIKIIRYQIENWNKIKF